MKRITLVVVSLVTIGAMSQPAAAHPPNRFRACTRQIPGYCTDLGAAFHYGDTVVLKGKVRPRHAGLMAAVLRMNPHGHRWRGVAKVRVSDAGTLRYRWMTTRDDAVQNAPYRFKFQIPGHGRSNATEAYVLFGE
jgi:hypothetical protein